jgi:hypothetical protein
LWSGSYRVGVYVGRDPITRKKRYLRVTAPDEARAKIELGKLLEKAEDGGGRTRT